MTMSDRIAVMNRGRYEQLGDPETLYERPRTPFVAGFLGVSNLLPATRAGQDGAYATFRLADGVAVRIPSALVEGGAPTVAIGVRPEKLRMIEPSKEVPAGLNRVSGVVSHASYLGVSTQYIVTLAGGQRVTVFEQNVERATKAELWTAGEQVILAWAPDHCFVVEEVAGASAEREPAAPAVA